MESFPGSYKTARDGGIAYRYEVTWVPNGKRTILWYARVLRDAEIVGTPSGVLRILEKRSGHAESIRLEVERAIEGGHHIA
jgi:hypothetical protein